MEKRNAFSSSDDQNAPAAFLVFVHMEKLLDKLKALNYEKELTKDLKLKPVHRHYFAMQTNPGEQFYAFTSLSAWLIRKSGKRFDQPQEFDDPNAIIAKILDHLRSFGVTIDFPPSKLKQGYGEHAVFVLDHLVNHAMKVGQFSWKKPFISEELDPEEELPEDESELVLERVEEEMLADAFSDDEPDDMLLRVEDLKTSSKTDGEMVQPESIMESTTNIENWKLELERVLPQLKVTIKSDNRDWRAHLEQMQLYQQIVAKAMDSTTTQLKGLHSEIAHSLDKIGAREKFLNKQLEPLLADYRKLQTELSRTQQHYQEMGKGVEERTHTLSMISDELESVKHEMEERGASMTDSTPLVNMKKTLAKVRAEILAMDVRIGVLDHSLLHAKLRDKAIMQQEIGSEFVL